MRIALSVAVLLAAAFAVATQTTPPAYTYTQLNGPNGDSIMLTAVSRHGKYVIAYAVLDFDYYLYGPDFSKPPLNLNQAVTQPAHNEFVAVNDNGLVVGANNSGTN